MDSFPRPIPDRPRPLVSTSPVALLARAVLAAALVAAVSPGARADTKSELRSARTRLAAVEARIAAGQAAAADLLRRSTALAAQLAVHREAYRRTQAQVARSREALAQAREDLEGLRHRLDVRAAAAYVGGPGSTIELLLGSSSMADFSSRLEFVNQLAGGDAALVQEIRRRSDALRRQAAELAEVEASQRRALAGLEAEDRSVRALFARQEQVLAGLAADRREAGALVTKLRKKLEAEELAAARAAAAAGRPVTLGRWAGYFLPRIGAPTCHQNMVLVVSWEVAEYTAARWNPLATTYPMPGATDHTPSGVKNYVSLEQGLEATELTLERGSPSLGYGPILEDLRRCSDAMSTAHAVDASSWCACGSYVADVVPAVEAYYEQYAGLTSPGS